MDYQQAQPVRQPSAISRWTDKITNSMLCNYFYIFFIIFAVWAGLALLGGIWIFISRSKMSIGMLISLIINVILSFGISGTTALFLYLICDRALMPAMRSGFADYEEEVNEEQIYEEEQIDGSQ